MLLSTSWLSQIYVRLYRWLNSSRGIIRRRYLEEQRRKQQRKLCYRPPNHRLSDTDIGLGYSRPQAFVCKSHVTGKENLVFTNGKSLYCCVHGERGMGPVWKVNVLTGGRGMGPVCGGSTCSQMGGEV